MNAQTVHYPFPVSTSFRKITDQCLLNHNLWLIFDSPSGVALILFNKLPL